MVAGPEEVFATVLTEVVVPGGDLRAAQAVGAAMLREPPQVEAPLTSVAT